MYELRKRLKNSRNGSILSSVYLAEVKAVAFAVISSGYHSQALLYTHSDQRYIRRNGIYPCWVRVDLYTAGDETTLQIFGSASALCISWLYSARGKYSLNTSSYALVMPPTQSHSSSYAPTQSHSSSYGSMHMQDIPISL